MHTAYHDNQHNLLTPTPIDYTIKLYEVKLWILLPTASTTSTTFLEYNR